MLAALSDGNLAHHFQEQSKTLDLLVSSAFVLKESSGPRTFVFLSVVLLPAEPTDEAPGDTPRNDDRDEHEVEGES